MKLQELLVITTLTVASLIITESEAQYCETSGDSTTCYQRPYDEDEKFIFYDLNKWEGFNLRRDVYMRLAIMLAEAQKDGDKMNFNLVLSPWHGLYHWQDDSYKTIPWNKFFDIEKLQEYTTVLELDDIMEQKRLEIDILYVLHNYVDAFEGGSFKEKWEIFKDEEDSPCVYEGKFWGVANITVKETVCVRFQGRASKLWELMPLHNSLNNIMFANSEIVLHGQYGSKEFWDCRKSMVFNQNLVKRAESFITENFNCNITKCDSFISVHVRRNDFVAVELKRVPSLKGTAKQVKNYKDRKNLKTTSVFIATDANEIEKRSLFQSFINNGLRPVFFVPDFNEVRTYTQGGIAIIDQIICSRAKFFIGTHESTFTFRIQEEREILGFNSDTTFNRLCPDVGDCVSPSRWQIVH